MTPAIGFTKDPVLKPWAAAQMQESNEEVLSGKRAAVRRPIDAAIRAAFRGNCSIPAEPIYFIQTPKEVWMIWQRDHMVRRIFFTDKHSEEMTPSWFGESIGHYENGELVVNTIGLSTHNSLLDCTAHAAYREGACGRALQADADGNMLEAQVWSKTRIRSTNRCIWRSAGAR